MRAKWSMVAGAAGLLAVATGIGACAPSHGLGGGDRTKQTVSTMIQIHYDVTKVDKEQRIRIKKVKDKKEFDDEKEDANTFGRCSATDGTCRPGYPVDLNGREYLGPQITASDGDPRDPNEVFFVSDATNPGRTCVCYGNRCYCN